MLLAIDTSTRYAGVAIADHEKVLVSRGWYSPSSHTAQLMPAISEALHELNLSIRDLDGIAVALGPGAFSALRVGMSVAKGLAMTGKKPLVGIGTLDLEVMPYLHSGMPVCALLDSGRKEVASAFFAIDGSRSRDDAISPPEELLPEVTQPTIFCGEGVTNWGDMIKEALGDIVTLVQPSPAGRISSLTKMGWQLLDSGESEDLTLLQPYYLRMPSIGGPKRRDLRPQKS